MARPSTPKRIMEILEMEGEWMTAHQLEADLALRWQPVKLATVRRAMHRLIDKQVLMSRVMGAMPHHEMEVRAA
jgi:Fe2+ or Zn2+ uptake regulation protein